MDSFIFTVEVEKLLPNAQWGSVAHGLLMERLPPEWAEALHSSDTRLYSQWIEAGETRVFRWHINTLEDALAGQIAALFSKGTVLSAQHLGTRWTVTETERSHTGMEEYVSSAFLSERAPSGLAVVFRTPATHKTNGEYACFPSVELTAYSLRRKLCAVKPDIAFSDDEVTEQIIAHTRISRYQLRSATYGLEGHYVMGYTGRMELHFSGPDPLRRLAYILFGFARWSGLGAKTSLGMGACSVSDIRGGKP